MNLPTIARALGGEVQGRQVLAPGPGHSRIDRSMSVRLSSQSPTGWITHSYVGDPFDLCRDFVTSKLGLDPDVWRSRSQGQARPTPVFTVPEPAPEPDDAARIARARAIFDEAGPATESIVEVYLAGRGLRLNLLSDVHSVVRFSERASWRDDATGEVIRVPAMIACMRSIADDAITAIHKTRLTPAGVKVGRKMQGLAGGAAIKLSADDEVTHGLHVAEGLETALAGLQLGLRPCWALGSAGGISSFPVLAGVEALSLLAENDAANARAVALCAERWAAAGSEVSIIRSTHGNDLNDVLKPEVV